MEIMQRIQEKFDVAITGGGPARSMAADKAAELSAFSKELPDKPEYIFLSKADLLNKNERDYQAKILIFLCFLHYYNAYSIHYYNS